MGITNDLEHRKQERQSEIDINGYIFKAGRRTARNGAKEWEDEQRKQGITTVP